ncbi:NgoFVII restriction endonuclease [Salinibacillus kushneri]|uniref:NgoFVII restriction endonuclease n=1 Tax=Salinibacillus kushneri TaxID=237682 RepID=A0A1I0A296_9BACI|nr:restriction endonuclease PLD domain-containing protein [Salinibacillus kushneri]SES88257.1 NgoFVII restriction endonuclease [Salinibacillus kushneri]
MFYLSQTESERKEYIKLLQTVGSLSHLFSDSPTPYLYYRAAENIFCRVFEAENLSRGDVSADAAKNKLGIGLKTFLHGNGKTYQKIAEFNKDLSVYEGKNSDEVVDIISKMRNERINFTMRSHGLNDMIYHLVTREEGSFNLYEEHMDLVDMSSIKSIKEKGNTIFFQDKFAEYKFYKAKSTLFKRFKTKKPIDSFDVEILKDPYSFLLERTGSALDLVKEPEETFEKVYLPLYSTRDGEVHAGSGLNQWNAGGRSRHHDELYIPIPKWIHEDFEGFFPYKLGSGKPGTPFAIVLPDGIEYNAKVCQENGKALMTNPNKLLGHWLLRHVLQVPVNTLVTYSMLEDIGIDSVVVTKINEDRFKIHFSKIGSYQEFEDEFKGSKKKR